MTMSSNLSYHKIDSEFNLIYCFFGKKDLLIEYANGINIFINNAIQNEYSPSTLYEKVNRKRRLKKMDCNIKGKGKHGYPNKVIITDNDHSVICNMYEGREYDFIDGEQIEIVGSFRNEIDSTTNSVFLDNCILLGDN